MIHNILIIFPFILFSLSPPKAGELSKALELCFQYRQYDILQQISEELSEGTNPETVRRVAEYFIQQEQFEKAVQILLQSHKVRRARDCKGKNRIRHNNF